MTVMLSASPRGDPSASVNFKLNDKKRVQEIPVNVSRGFVSKVDLSAVRLSDRVYFDGGAFEYGCESRGNGEQVQGRFHSVFGVLVNFRVAHADVLTFRKRLADFVLRLLFVGFFLGVLFLLGA